MLINDIVKVEIQKGPHVSFCAPTILTITPISKGDSTIRMGIECLVS